MASLYIESTDCSVSHDVVREKAFEAAIRDATLNQAGKLRSIRASGYTAQYRVVKQIFGIGLFQIKPGPVSTEKTFLVLMFVGPALLNRGASVAGHVKPNNRWFVSRTCIRFVSPKSDHSMGLDGTESKPKRIGVGKLF